MKNPSKAWATAGSEVTPKAVVKPSDGAFRSQMKALGFFEFLLGHNLSVGLEPGERGAEGRWKRSRWRTNLVACILIGVPAIGASCTPSTSVDQSIILLVAASLHFLTLKICIGSQRRFHALIDQIELFDRSFAETFAFERPPGRNLWWACLWVLLTLAYPIPLMLFIHNEIFGQLNSEPYTLIAQTLGMTFHETTVLQRSLIFVQFISVGRGMKCRFGLIRRLLEQELSKGRPGPSAATLESIRVHHARLSVLVDSMNESCCKRLVFPILSIAIEFLFIFFRYVFHDNFHIHPLLATNLVTDLVAIKIVASVSEAIVFESRMPLYVMRAVIISKLPFLCQAQIMMFQDQILAVPVQISAGGFFYLDNKLLTELALLIVTYCTVILQLAPNEEDEENETTESILSNNNNTNIEDNSDNGNDGNIGNNGTV